MKTTQLVTLALASGSVFLMAAQTASKADSLNAPKPGVVRPLATAVGGLGIAVMSAAINGSDGTIARAEGASSSETKRFSAGTYEVGFVRDITECFYSVTVGESSIGGATPAVAGVTRRSCNPNGVFIRIVNPPDEVSEDRDFFVLVYCNR